MATKVRKYDAPDGGYGWLILVTAFMTQYIVGSLFVTYSMLMVEFSEAFGVNMATVGWGGSISIGVSSLAGVPVGMLIHRFGCRPVCMIGGVLCGIGLVSTSFVTNMYMVYLTFGLLTGLGSCGIRLASLLIIQQYFDKRRASVTGISLIGNSVASVTWTPLFRVLVVYLGWRGAVAVHGCLALQGVALGATYRPLPRPVQMTARHKQTGSDVNNDIRNLKVDTVPAQNGAHSNQKPFAKNPHFLFFGLSNILIAYGVLTMYIQSPSRAVFYGLTKTQASLLPSSMGAVSTCSRLTSSLIVGMASAREKRLLLFSIASTLGGIVALLSCLGSDDFVSSVAFCAAYGLNLGAFMSLHPTVVVDLVGMELAAKGQGLSHSLAGIASLTGLPFTGWLFDITQNYNVPYYVTGSMQVAGGLLSLFIFVHKHRQDMQDSSMEHIDIELKAHPGLQKEDAIYDSQLLIGM